MINSVLEELKLDRQQFVKNKIKRDKLIALAYILFICIVAALWYLNNQNFVIPKWLSTSIAIFLFVVPLSVLRLINYSFSDSIFYRNKAEKKYEKEFDNQTK
jgi:small-conductance mechanosensitive channel